MLGLSPKKQTVNGNTYHYLFKMSYYGYHPRILQRINNAELKGFEYVDEYKGDKDFKLLLYFDTEPQIRPIRKHRLEQYEKLLK